jgi:hypothetical protein
VLDIRDVVDMAPRIDLGSSDFREVVVISPLIASISTTSRN